MPCGAHGGEEAVRSPGPVADDRVDKAADAERCRKHVAEPSRCVRSSRPEVMVEQVSAKAYWKSQKARKATPVCFIRGRRIVQDRTSYVPGVPSPQPIRPFPCPNIKAKPNAQKAQAAEAGIEDALHENVDGLAGAAETRFEKRKARLHSQKPETRQEGSRMY